jgi:hypothetical protein
MGLSAIAEPRQSSDIVPEAQRSASGGQAGQLFAGNEEPEPRSEAYAKMPTVFKPYTQPAIPINAPPAEMVLRPAGSIMPSFTEGICPSTAQQRQTAALHDIRNLILNRTMFCTFGCNFSYRLDEEQRLHDHAKSQHCGRQCPFCDSALFAHMDADEANKHMREKHGKELIDLVRTMRFERQWDVAARSAFEDQRWMDERQVAEVS